MNQLDFMWYPSNCPYFPCLIFIKTIILRPWPNESLGPEPKLFSAQYEILSSTPAGSSAWNSYHSRGPIWDFESLPSSSRFPSNARGVQHLQRSVFLSWSNFIYGFLEFCQSIYLIFSCSERERERVASDSCGPMYQHLWTFTLILKCIDVKNGL